MTIGMTRRGKGQGAVRASWGSGFLEKQLKAFTNREKAEGGKERERQEGGGRV